MSSCHSRNTVGRASETGLLRAAGAGQLPSAVPAAWDSLKFREGLAAGEHADQFTSQIGSPDDPALGVVVEPVPLAGCPLMLGIDSVLAEGGYLEEFRLVSGEAFHGGSGSCGSSPVNGRPSMSGGNAGRCEKVAHEG